MAARENQGLQIALIIFVMLTIVLTVTTFLFFSSARDAEEKIKGLTQDNANKDGAARAALDESAKAKSLLDPKLDKIEAVEETAKKDFEAHGKNLAEADQNYRGLTAHLAKELAGANTRITEITAKEKELIEKIAAEEAATKKAIEEYTQTIVKITKDLEDRSKGFDEFRDQINQEKVELTKKFDDTRKRFDDLTNTSGEQITGLKEENTKLDTLLKAVNTEKNRQTAANEIADGKIQWVNQRSRTVWINLGSDDGLRRQTAFSAFSSDASNPVETDRKGKIEVIRLLGPHMAEAKILEDDLSNPLMPGDQIYSPTWEPGRAEHFALAGFMDIDGDDEPDRQRVRDLIIMNGGVIDEELSDDGKKTGNMTINTKYLVRGDQPKVAEDSGGLAGWSEINGRALTLGIRTMNVNELLDYMGYKPEDRTVKLGTGANSADFKARLPGDTQRVMPGSGKIRDLRRASPTREDF